MKKIYIRKTIEALFLRRLTAEGPGGLLRSAAASASSSLEKTEMSGSFGHVFQT